MYNKKSVALTLFAFAVLIGFSNYHAVAEENARSDQNSLQCKTLEHIDFVNIDDAHQRWQGS